MKTIQRSCPHCGASNYEDRRLGDNNFKIVQRKECNFVYMPVCAEYEEMSENLAWSSQFVKEKKSRKSKRPVFNYLDQKTRWRLHIFPRPETYSFTNRMVQEGNIVDLGCSGGGNLLRLEGNIIPFGIEIEKQRAEEAHQALSVHGGRCVHAPAIEGLHQFDDNFFHGAMMNSFLEHENQPLEPLFTLRSKMHNTGVCVLKVPNFSSWNASIMKSAWCGIRIPDHVNYFTPKSLERMAKKAGFDCTFPPTANLPTNDNFWAFLRPAVN